MQVESVASASAVLCAEHGSAARRPVDVSLLEGTPAPGDWLLVHVGIGIRALEAAEAQQIADALRAVDAAARGQPFEHLIADLIDREPELPPHLRAGAGGGTGNG
jgi:hydrogenase expression/formation protein HypC